MLASVLPQQPMTSSSAQIATRTRSQKALDQQEIGQESRDIEGGTDTQVAVVCSEDMFV
jgi:hypothetical protein